MIRIILLIVSYLVIATIFFKAIEWSFFHGKRPTAEDYEDYYTTIITGAIFWPISLCIYIGNMIWLIARKIYVKISTIGALREIKKTSKEMSKGTYR